MADRAKGIQIHRPIVYGSVARLLTPQERTLCKDPNHTHTWTVFVRSAASPVVDAKSRERERSLDDELLPGGADDLGYLLKRVSFRLHDSFPTPLRNIDRPPYQVTETGWGEFPLQIRLTFVPEANEKPIHIVHNLKLHHYLPVVPVVAAPAAPPLPLAPSSGAGSEPSGPAGPLVQETASAAAATAAAEGAKPMEVDVDEATAAAGLVASGPGLAAQMTGAGQTKVVDPIIIDQETNTVELPASSAPAQSGSAGPVIAPPAPEPSVEGGQAAAATGAVPSVQPSNPPSAAGSSTPVVETPSAIAVDLTALVDKTSLVAQATSTAPGAPAAVPAGPVNAYQYDELVFTNPPASFLALLQAHPPTPLPVQPRVKGRLEFTLGLEREEGERIDEGRRQVVRETDSWRKRLIEAEREVARLREEVGGL